MSPQFEVQRQQQPMDSSLFCIINNETGFPVRYNMTHDRAKELAAQWNGQQDA